MSFTSMIKSENVGQGGRALLREQRPVEQGGRALLREQRPPWIQGGHQGALL